MFCLSPVALCIRELDQLGILQHVGQMPCLPFRPSRSVCDSISPMRLACASAQPMTRSLPHGQFARQPARMHPVIGNLTQITSI